MPTQTWDICKGGGGNALIGLGNLVPVRHGQNSGQFSINPLTWIIKAILGWRIPLITTFWKVTSDVVKKFRSIGWDSDDSVSPRATICWYVDGTLRFCHAGVYHAWKKNNTSTYFVPKICGEKFMVNRISWWIESVPKESPTKSNPRSSWMFLSKVLGFQFGVPKLHDSHWNIYHPWN